MNDNKTAESTNSKLLDLYLQWSQKIDNSLFGDKFSNPYYISVPRDWWKKKNRIMIVGEEGAGQWGAGKAYLLKGDEKWNPQTETGINIIMEYNDQTVERKDCRRGMFWSRIRQICNLNKDISIVWNNIDKIHRLGNKGRECKLTDKQRKLLHQESILEKEIEILKPTIIVFLGWHWTSLQKELPELYDYAKQKYADNKNEPFVLKDKVFSLHPNSPVGRTRVYGESVLEQIKSLL